MKKAIKQVARQIAQEPLETLRQAGKQVVGEVQKPMEVAPSTPEAPRVSPGVPLEEKKRIQTRDTRLIQALEEEIKDIRKQKEVEEAERMQEEEPQKIEKRKPLPSVPTKPSRRLFAFGAKAQAEKQKTRVEKPLPPSG
ncbi:MAG: hypothetical protein AAB875_07245 [Patescibacteria group bacterium]